VQTDLDGGPVVVRKSRIKSVQMILVSVGFCGLLAWDAQTSPTTPWYIWPGIVLFGLGGLMFAWQLVRPEQLIISQAGLEWRSLSKTMTYRWDQLSEFSVFSIRGAKMIGFSTPAQSAPARWLGQFNAEMIGHSAALPGLWEMKPEALADLLNAARTRWRR
jgi:hypothetical protein